MSRGRGGYSSYRGRKTIHDILKGVAILLLLLVVLLLGIVFFGPEHIGLPGGIPHPFLSQEPQDPGDISLVILPADSRQEEAPPEETQAVLAAVELPLESVLDGTAPAQLEAARANALILNMKNEEGQLGWVSRQELAVLAGVSAQTGGINESLQQWNQGDTYTVARLCCFRDNSVPYYRNSTALRTVSGNWRDELSLRWLNPASADAQTYLAGLCAELAELGFDEILLECCSFPTQGRLDAISTKIDSETQAMEDFLSQVQAALEPYDTVLSIRTEAAALTGAEPLGGLTAACLETYAGRLWLAGDDAAAAGINGDGQPLVRIVPALEPESPDPQAVFLGAGES